MKLLLPLVTALFLTSCATGKKQSNDKTFEEIDRITNKDFKKDAPLMNSQLKDYFVNNAQNIENPILKDETLSRLKNSEIDDFKNHKDPLVGMAYLCEKKHFKDAYSLASKYYDRYKNIASYWNQIGICYLDENKHRKALLYFNKALEVDKNYVPTLNNFGVMYMRQNQPQKAIVAYERASELGKFSKTPRYNLARLYLSYGLSEKALPILQSLSNQTQNDVGITNAIATAYLMQGDYHTSLRFFGKLSSKLLERPEIGINASYAFFLSGNSKQAIKTFENIKKPRNEVSLKYYTEMAHKVGVKL